MCLINKGAGAVLGAVLALVSGLSSAATAGNASDGAAIRLAARVMPVTELVLPSGDEFTIELSSLRGIDSPVEVRVPFELRGNVPVDITIAPEETLTIHDGRDMGRAIDAVSGDTIGYEYTLRDTGPEARSSGAQLVARQASVDLTVGRYTGEIALSSEADWTENGTLASAGEFKGKILVFISPALR